MASAAGIVHARAAGRLRSAEIWRTAIGLISAFLLACAVVTLRRDGQSAAATA